MIYDKDKIHFAKTLRTNQTREEKLLWSALRNRRLNNLKFRRQFPIGGYILDFYCSEKNIAIEIDGESHEFRYDYDNNRTFVLERLGIKILRFTNENVYNNLQGVLIDIEKLCEETSPCPSPVGEGT